MMTPEMTVASMHLKAWLRPWESVVNKLTTPP